MAKVIRVLGESQSDQIRRTISALILLLSAELVSAAPTCTVSVITRQGISEGSSVMRVVIQQHNSLRRELVILGLLLLFAIVTVVVLLVPGIIN